MDIVFTVIGLILVLAVWPALLVYASNDSLLRQPRGSVRARVARARGRHGVPLTLGGAGRAH